MEHIRAIRTEEDHDAALSRIYELMTALSGTEGQTAEAGQSQLGR